MALAVLDAVPPGLRLDDGRSVGCPVDVLDEDWRIRSGAAAHRPAREGAATPHGDGHRSHRRPRPARVSSFAYLLMHALRRLGAEGTQFARAQCSTLRLKLLKIGARVKITARRIWLSFSQAYPYAKTFTQVLANLQRAPLWNPSG